jgi:hypothetical protein
VGDNLNQNTSYADLGLTGLLQKPLDPGILLRTVSAKLK